jgi:hypothetical protein
MKTVIASYRINPVPVLFGDTYSVNMEKRFLTRKAIMMEKGSKRLEQFLRSLDPELLPIEASQFGG